MRDLLARALVAVRRRYWCNCGTDWLSGEDRVCGVHIADWGTVDERYCGVHIVLGLTVEPTPAAPAEPAQPPHHIAADPDALRWWRTLAVLDAKAACWRGRGGDFKTAADELSTCLAEIREGAPR